MRHGEQNGGLSMANYAIRPLKYRDLPKLLKLAHAYWKFENIQGFSPKQYQRLAVKILKNPSLGRIWIAVERNRLIGYLVVVFLMSLEYGGTAGEIDELYVESSERGRGVGGALLKAAGKTLLRKGVGQVSLRVGKSNSQGIRFYKNLGFRKRNEFLVMDRKKKKGDCEAP